MRILHVIPSFAPAWRYGGPVVAALGLTRELARQGHDVTVITTNIDGPGVLDVPTGRPVTRDGVEVRYFQVERPRWYCFSRPLARALRHDVGQFEVVHLHSIYLWPTTAAAFWCRRRGVPYVVHTIGSLDPVMVAKSYESWPVSAFSRAKKSLYFNTVGRLDLGGASGIHYTSQADMDSCAPLGLRPPGYVIPLGVDAPPRTDGEGGRKLRDRYPQLRDRKIVLFFSRLARGKGMEVLVTALAALTPRADFALVVAGGGDEGYKRQMESLVRAQGLQDRTVFLGLVKGGERWRVLSQADLFVLPSYHENFPMAVVEAMASGLPVVISDRVKIHREIAAAGAGIVTSLAPPEVSAAIAKLLDNDGFREQTGGAARRLALEELSWETAAKTAVAAYNDIIDRTRAAAGGVEQGVAR